MYVFTEKILYSTLASFQPQNTGIITIHIHIFIVLVTCIRTSYSGATSLFFVSDLYARLLIPVIAVSACSFPFASADTLPSPGKLMETEKIELLISSIETMQDARFIRNGKEYSSAKAAQHLRKKWSHVKKRISTADQFIEYIASKSSISNKPYQIKLADGSIVTSEAVLRKRLSEIEKTAPVLGDSLQGLLP